MVLPFAVIAIISVAAVLAPLATIAAFTPFTTIAPLTTVTPMFAAIPAALVARRRPVGAAEAARRQVETASAIIIDILDCRGRWDCRLAHRHRIGATAKQGSENYSGAQDQSAHDHIPPFGVRGFGALAGEP